MDNSRLLFWFWILGSKLFRNNVCDVNRNDLSSLFNPTSFSHSERPAETPVDTTSVPLQPSPPTSDSDVSDTEIAVSCEVVQEVESAPPSFLDDDEGTLNLQLNFVLLLSIEYTQVTKTF